LLISAGDRGPDEALRALVEAAVPIVAYEAQPIRLGDAFLAVTGQECG
jgi:hypothetical protein